MVPTMYVPAKPHEITTGADGLYNMNNMAAVDPAHGLTPKQFGKRIEGVHGHYYTLMQNTK
jgi:hypothetical protein